MYGLPVANPDVRVWEVKNAAGGHVGFWYFDPYARPGKNSGAWMSEYRGQDKLDHDVAPIVSNNTNFLKDESGGPLLISWDDAVTLFHEFGHALHGLNSDVKYPSLAGTNVVRDFVEFPSQLNENWLSTPEVLSRFAVHYQTGKPIPADAGRQDQEGQHLQSRICDGGIPGVRAGGHEAASGGHCAH